jgi:hypothetical protein
MNQGIEQICVIKFRFKESCSRGEIPTRLKTVHGAPCYAKRTVFSWMQRVNFDKTLLVDAPTSGRTSLDHIDEKLWLSLKITIFIHAEPYQTC